MSSIKSDSSHLKTLFLLLICYLSDYNIVLKFQTTSELKTSPEYLVRLKKKKNQESQKVTYPFAKPQVPSRILSLPYMPTFMPRKRNPHDLKPLKIIHLQIHSSYKQRQLPEAPVVNWERLSAVMSHSCPLASSSILVHPSIILKVESSKTVLFFQHLVVVLLLLSIQQLNLPRSYLGCEQPRVYYLAHSARVMLLYSPSFSVGCQLRCP